MGWMKGPMAAAVLLALAGCRGGAPRAVGDVAETTRDVFWEGAEGPGEIARDLKDVFWETSVFERDPLREIGGDVDALLDLDGFRPPPGKGTAGSGTPRRGP